MKRLFNNKVNTERKVLKAVNETCGSPTLNGLAKVAVDAWNISNAHANPEIVSTLYILSKRMILETDVSRNVFDIEELELLEPINNSIMQLEKQLMLVNNN